MGNPPDTKDADESLQSYTEGDDALQSRLANLDEYKASISRELNGKLAELQHLTSMLADLRRDRVSLSTSLGGLEAAQQEGPYVSRVISLLRSWQVHEKNLEHREETIIEISSALGLSGFQAGSIRRYKNQRLPRETPSTGERHEFEIKSYEGRIREGLAASRY